MTVSFDFDGVLARPGWQVIAAYHLKEGDQVYVLTARCEPQGDRVKTEARALGIPADQVVFTCNRDKWEQIDELGIDLHYDDNPDQVKLINEDTGGLALDVTDLDPARYLLEGLDGELDAAENKT